MLYDCLNIRYTNVAIITIEMIKYINWLLFSSFLFSYKTHITKHKYTYPKGTCQAGYSSIIYDIPIMENNNV